MILQFLPENKVEDILCRFNSICKKLKFTLEKSVNNNIHFLHLNIQIINNKIKTNWYRKPIWSGRYINFFLKNRLSLTLFNFCKTKHKKIVGFIRSVV